MNNYKKDIIDFLEKNGWEKDKTIIDHESFNKPDNIGVDIEDNCVILVGDCGEFKEFPLNIMTKYSMLGYFFHHKYIAIDYKI